MRRAIGIASWREAVAWLLLGCLQFGCSEKTAAPVVVLVAPRDFGYTVGTVVEHRIIVDLPPDATVDPNLLPSPGPVGDWLDLRTVRWSMPTEHRLQLDLGYLILRGVKAPEPAVVPALPVRIRQRDTVTELHAPEWSFTLMPVIPPGIPDEQLVVRGMHAPDRPSTEAAVWAMVASLSAAAACLLLIALRRGWFPALAAPPPFTAALREIERPRFSLRPDDRDAQALKRIHRAIDETAGWTVFPTGLPVFLEQNPAFRPLRKEFEQFFQISERLFFASSDGQGTAQTEHWPSLLDFCRRCSRSERGIR